MKKLIIAGMTFIVLGLAMIIYYDYSIKPNKEAQVLLTEGKLIFERGDDESINRAIDIFSKIIARYPGTESEFDAYYMIAQAYQKLKLNRLAYLKYIYILKNNEDLSPKIKLDIKARIGKLKILKKYDAEGIHDLLDVLSSSSDREFRSRIYTELGHTYLRMGQYRKSLRMFNLALEENGQNEEAVIGKARAYKRLGMDNRAYTFYEHFLNYFGDQSYYTKDVRRSFNRQLYESGRKSYIRGSYYPAISFFRSYIRKFPWDRKTENALYFIGQSFFKLKKYGSAIKYFKRVRSNNFHHKDQEALIRIGYAYFIQKKYKNASREFQKYLEAYPQGAYREKAGEWKKMSNREIFYRDENREREDNSSFQLESEDERERVNMQAGSFKTYSPVSKKRKQQISEEERVNVAEL